MVPIPLLTPEVLRQTQKKPHRLVVLVSRTTGGTQHQSFSPRSSGGPKNAINVCALNHLRKDRDRRESKIKTTVESCESERANGCPDEHHHLNSLTHISFFVFIGEGQRARKPLGKDFQPAIPHGFYQPIYWHPTADKQLGD